MGEAEFLSQDPRFRSSVERLLASPHDPAAKQEVIQSLTLIKRGDRFHSLAVVTRGATILASTEANETISLAEIQQSERALRERKIMFGDQLLGGGSTFNISAPIFGGLRSVPVAVVQMRLSPRTTITPMLRSIRSSRRTLETVLLDRAGPSATHLTDLKFPQIQPMKLGSLIRDRSGKIALSGTRILNEAVDYRGQPVMAAINPVPGTPWVLLSKLDEDEVLAEFRGHVALFAAVFAFFLLAQALGIGLIWHHREASALWLRLHQEEDRRAGFERLALLMSSSRDAVLVIDKLGKIVESNPAASELYGYSKDELAAQSLADLRECAQVEIPDGDGLREERHCGKGDNCFPVEVSQRSIKLDETTYDVVVARDIRQRKKAEEQLGESMAQLKRALEAVQTSEQRFRSFVEASSLIVWRADPDGYVREISSQYSLMTGADPTQGLGSGWLDLIHPDDKESVEGKVRVGIDSKMPFEFEARRKNANGEYRYIAARGVPIFDDEGQIREWVGASQDIHDQKLAEQFLVQSQKMEALGTIAGGIAHDFNNILRAIAGNVRLTFESLPEGDIARGPLVQVEKSCYRAFNLVQQILTFSRQTESRLRPIALAEVVSEALALLRPSLPTNVDLKVTMDGTAPYVKADPSQVHQAFLNLVANAIQAMGEDGGSLKVSLCCDEVRDGFHKSVVAGSYVRLTVADTGPGISPEVQKLIFDPFFTTKPQGQGTGLGLSVVHGIMAAHGGLAEVISEPGNGATFRLYFPTTADAPAVQELPKKGVETLSTGRVLYVDDDEMLVRLASRTLPRRGFEVQGFCSAVEAVGVFEADPHAFDVVITDITMPEMTGFELAAKLIAIRPDIQVVALSGFVRAEDETQASQVGIRKVLLKTLGDDELVETLCELAAAA